MIIPLDKLLMFEGNKYIFSKSAMFAVDKIANMKKYPENNLSWKVVPNVLKMCLEGSIKFEYNDDDLELEQK